MATLDSSSGSPTAVPSLLCETEVPNSFPMRLRVRAHTFRSDVGASSGSTDSAPGPHDYFDAALAACKALTATWYARKHQMPLERVETRIERNDSEERRGKYTLKVHLSFQGPLTPDQRSRLYAAVAACPIHKLMTSAEVVVETAPLEEGAAS
ncbi:MAG TPA: OsmC family protein [Planctomycetota bacterium]|nr:OsmC family protein [Planctomycetota bacterium]